MLAVLAAGVSAAACTARAQDAVDARALAERVARAGDGTVRFQYPVRAGVCGDGGRGVTWVREDDTSHFGSWNSSDDARWAVRCEPGPARVALLVRGGAVQSVRLAVGSRSPVDGGTDLGAVPAPAAAAYLLDVAARSSAPSAEQLTLAAAVADAGAVWPGMLRLARDDRAPGPARRAASFWASQFACDGVRAARARRGALARADTTDRDVRKQVVFALSQRRGDEGTAPLVRVARADRDPAVRCAALFWLGQAPRGRGGLDASTLGLFEEVLRAP